VLDYEEEEDYGGRNRDAEGALFAVTVDAHGVVLDDTMSFSSCAWATGRLYVPGPGAPSWLDGFDDLSKECEEALYQLLARPVRYFPPLPGDAPGKAKPDDEGGPWTAVVTDILGAAAAGAVTGLIGTLAPVLGGVAGAGAIAGMAGSLIGRLTQRAEEAEQQEPAASEPPLAQPASDEPRRSLQLPDLVAFAAYVTNILSLPSGLADPLELRIETVPVGRKKDGSLPDQKPVFLTSIIAPDLHRIAGEVALDPGAAGPALTSYLTAAENAERRVDLAQDRAAVIEGVQPAAFPLARWPADAGHSLVAGQQFAVNTILAELGKRGAAGLFSVNGPPGTGKTTMLRDLIASVVVQRALALARLPNPRAGFHGSESWTASDGSRHMVRRPHHELTGFEIVVASSNNNAVENITKELPAADAIGAEWRDEASFFADRAEAFFGEPAWGMVAAPLGNKDKQKAFREDFWWAEGAGMHHALQVLEAGQHIPQWQEAVDSFNAAFAAAADLAAERHAACGALWDPVDETRLTAAAEAARVSRDRLDQAIRDREGAAAALASLEHAVGICATRAQWHERSKPGGIRGILGVGDKVQHWHEQGRQLAAELGDLYAELAKARKLANGRQRQETLLRETANSCARTKADLDTRRHDNEQHIRQAREQWSGAFPDGWLALTAVEQERAAPWSDEEWTRARTRVFLAALDLHRAFIASNAKTIRLNVNRFFDALAREPRFPPEAELAAWQTLFLVVPVISTTFASCGRLFGALGGQTLGWVLVDEAGQALPQAAAGALWRAQRAVIVGDPLQLEPISQVPAQVQAQLGNLFGTAETWLPARTSAQALADRRNRWGTHVPRVRRDGEVEQVWVGAPLRVHRRCEQPMFGICNDIAYHGHMVYGTKERPFPGNEHPEYPPSSWVDVTGPAHGKWVPAQGAALARILERLHSNYEVSLDRIYVLSPFRDVVNRCRSLVRDTEELRCDGLTEFIDDQIGTVHTMQGKEADVVVLVLGTDPNPAKKARDWAASPVNLLNVAVSRARRRLFVIGSYDEWCVAPNFSVLAATFHRHPWKPQDNS
jgi:hypothetical protein